MLDGAARVPASYWSMHHLGRVYASTRDAGSGGQQRGSAPPRQQTQAGLDVATSLAGFTRAALIVCSAPSDKRRHVQRVVAAAIKPHRGSASRPELPQGQSCRSRTRQKLTCQPFVRVCVIWTALLHTSPPSSLSHRSRPLPFASKAIHHQSPADHRQLQSLRRIHPAVAALLPARPTARARCCWSMEQPSWSH